jgi:hypothetical protein
MPTFLGAGRAGITGGGGGGVFGTQDNPITDDATGALWADSLAGSTVSGVAYVQKSGLNGGNAYQVYCAYVSSKLWVMAGVFAGADSTNTSSGANLFRWCPCKSPTTSTNNDWGTGTHVFNDTYDYTSYTGNNKSARSRAWAELATNRSRFLFYNQSQSSPLIYSFTSSSGGGENASWGTRMKTVSDYFRNGTAIESIAANDIVGTVPSGTLQDTRWSRLGLGASDGEATTANTHDVVMIIAQGTTSNTTSTVWGNSGQNSAGLGVKRSQVSGDYPTSFTFNGSGGDSKCGVILTPGAYNGNISFDTDGHIIIYQALESD